VEFASPDDPHESMRRTRPGTYEERTSIGWVAAESLTVREEDG